MPSRTDRIDFGPPSDAGRLRAFSLALLVHALLIAALTWGVSWNRSDSSPSFSAELWSSTAQQAAPALNAPPPPPPPPPVAVSRPAAVTPPPAPAPPVTRNVDIAVEQEKKRKLAEQKLEREQEAAQDKRQAALDAKAEKDQQLKQEKLQEKLEAQVLAKQQAASDAKKQDTAKADAKTKAAASAAALEEQRKQQLARVIGMAGAQGDDSSKGSAQQSSGPTAAYRNRLAALFKRNIIFSNVDSIQGNPKAEVQVKVSSTGLIMSARLSKSSGVPAWDEAVLRAVEKTERIPLDENGKVVADFPIGFGPKD